MTTIYWGIPQRFPKTQINPYTPGCDRQYSLGEMRTILEAGVTFRSPINGDTLFLGPEQSIAFQHALGADIVMVLDECTPYPAGEVQAAASMERSLTENQPAIFNNFMRQGWPYPYEPSFTS
jgi:tRNA-guanine family transglycosylase